MKLHILGFLAFAVVTTSAVSAQACGGKSVYDQDIVRSPPAILMESETSRHGTFNGKWEWIEAGQSYEARWNNGATAVLRLLEFGVDEIILYREDDSGPSKGLKACYTGYYRDGQVVGGDVTWTFANGNKTSGKWSANSR